MRDSKGVYVKLAFAAISTLFIVLLSALALYFSEAAGYIDHRFGDMVIKIRGLRHCDAPVVLLRIDRAAVEKIGRLPWGKSQAEAVLDAIEKLGPRRIIVGAGPEIVFLEPELINNPRLIKPIDWQLSHGDEDTPLLLNISDSDGVVRHLYSRHPNPGVRGIAWQYEAIGIKPEVSEIGVNFVGPPNSISNLSVADVVTGSMPRDFLKGKFVVIGLDLPGFTRVLSSPVSSNDHPLSEAEFHAHALITLLEGSRINLLGIGWSLLLLALLTVCLWLLFLPSTFRRNIFVALAAGLLLSAVAVVLLLTINLILPVTGFATAILLTFVISSEQKSRTLQERVRNIANTSTWELTLHPGAGDINNMSVDEIWQRLVGFASVHLSPAGMALALPVDAGENRIKFDHFFGMSESDIRENRRDLSRMPYAAILTRPEVTRVDRFMKEENGTVSFLVPLFYPSKLMGIWLLNFRLKENIVDERMNFLLMVGQQVARMLYHSRMNTEERKSSIGYSFDWLEKQVANIDRIVGNLIREKDVYQSVLDGLLEGVAFTDMFGRVLHMSVSMKSILTGLSVNPEEVNTLSALLKELGIAVDGDVSSRLLQLNDRNSENVFNVNGYYFVLRVLYSSKDAEHPLPEGMLLLALKGECSALPGSQNTARAGDEFTEDGR